MAWPTNTSMFAFFLLLAGLVLVFTPETTKSPDSITAAIESVSETIQPGTSDSMSEFSESFAE